MTRARGVSHDPPTPVDARECGAPKTMISRDLKGYGKDYPVIAWPGDALLAVSLVVEFEEGAERSPLYGDDGHIHDNFMVHQKTYVEAQTGTVRAARGDSKPGDYIEFYAEIDLLVALSACPLGDALRDVVTGRGEAHPMGVEVYETGIEPREFPMWTDWRPGWKGKWTPPQS